MTFSFRTRRWTVNSLTRSRSSSWIPYARIAGDDYPAEVVKSRFLKLDSSHVQYVMDCMRDNTTYVRNIKKYLLAALYNAPSTINSYYSSLVQHDMYGDGRRGRE